MTMNNMDMSEIESRLLVAIKGCHSLVPPERAGGITSLVKAGEPGVALEILFDNLSDQDAVVPPATLQELIALGRAMRLNERYWKTLE